jgi:hypothetical protein
MLCISFLFFSTIYQVKNVKGSLLSELPFLIKMFSNCHILRIKLIYNNMTSNEKLVELHYIIGENI